MHKSHIALMNSLARTHDLHDAINKFTKMAEGEDLTEYPLQYAVRLYNQCDGPLSPRQEMFAVQYSIAADSVKAYHDAYSCADLSDDKTLVRVQKLLDMPKIQRRLDELHLYNAAGSNEILQHVAGIVLDPSPTARNLDKLKAAEIYFRHIGEYQTDGQQAQMSDEELNERIEQMGYVRHTSPLDDLEIEDEEL